MKLPCHSFGSHTYIKDNNDQIILQVTHYHDREKIVKMLNNYNKAIELLRHTYYACDIKNPETEQFLNENN